MNIIKLKYSKACVEWIKINYSNTATQKRQKEYQTIVDIIPEIYFIIFIYTQYSASSSCSRESR